jgi:O-antigen/teichoic acid export membrane protein
LTNQTDIGASHCTSIRWRSRLPGALLDLFNQPAVAMTSVVNILSAVLTGASGIFVARLLGPHDRGIYASALTWGTVLVIVIQLGINQAIVYAAAKKPVSPERLLGAILTISGVQSAVLLVTSAVVIPELTMFSEETRGALRLYCLYLPSWLTLIYLTCFCLGLGQMTLFNWFKLLNAAPPLLSVCWALTGAATVAVIFHAFLVSGYVIMAACLSINVIYGTRASWGYVVEDVPLLVRYGLRAYWSNLFSFANFRLDQLVLSTSVPLAAFGAYSVAASYSMLLYPFAAAIANLLFPKMASASQQDRVRHLRRSTQSIFLVMTVGVLTLICLQHWLVPFLYGPRYGGLELMITVLCAASWCFGVNYVFSDALRGLNRPGLVSSAEAVSACVTCVGLYVALPRLGIIGAAWVSLASYAVVSAILAAAIRRSLRIDTIQVNATAA